MEKRKLSKGDKVMIFIDPYTEKKREGIATVVKRVGPTDYYGCVLCNVRFSSDDIICQRRIRVVKNFLL